MSAAEYTLAALGPVFTRIDSNGSGSVLPIEALFDRLKTDALDPAFEKYGNFAYETPCIADRDDEGNIVDGAPLFPEHAGVWAFFGNFLTYSHVFSIYSNDPAFVKSLRLAIAINKASAAYQALKAAA